MVGKKTSRFVVVSAQARSLFRRRWNIRTKRNNERPIGGDDFFYFVFRSVARSKRRTTSSCGALRYSSIFHEHHSSSSSSTTTTSSMRARSSSFFFVQSGKAATQHSAFRRAKARKHTQQGEIFCGGLAKKFSLTQLLRQARAQTKNSNSQTRRTSQRLRCGRDFVLVAEARK